MVNSKVSVFNKEQFLRRITYFREIGIIIMLIITFVAAGIVEPRFFLIESIRSIILYIPLIIVVSIGECMVIITRGIDLSVGSIVGLTGMIIGIILRDYSGFPIWLSFILAFSIGAVLGSFNGLLVALLDIPAIIATLGTLYVYRGLAFIVSGGHQINPNEIPTALIYLTQTSPFGKNLPWITIIALLIAGVMHLFFHYSRSGRYMFAIGSNPEGALLKGVPVKKVLIIIFSFSGALSGIAGIMYASRMGFVNPGETGVGFEFVVITAAIIGGANVFGGSGSVFGTLLGSLLLGTISVALSVLGISGFWQLAVYGLIIVIAVMLDAITRISLQREYGVRGRIILE